MFWDVRGKVHVCLHGPMQMLSFKPVTILRPSESGASIHARTDTLAHTHTHKRTQLVMVEAARSAF